MEEEILQKINSGQGKDYSFFKKKQWEAISAAKNNDVMVVLPTGYGKSLIIETLPYLAEPPTCVVVANPLNAIIMEQKDKFGENCVVIDRTIINLLKEEKTGDTDDPSRLAGDDDSARSIEKLKNGLVNYIIGHPEHLQDDAVKRILQNEILAKKVRYKQCSM